MPDKENKYPYCFGDLEKVFPMSENGLRNTPDSCYFHCKVKTSCLRQAFMGYQGCDLKEELLERQTHEGVTGFFQRWLRKKQIHLQRHSREGKDSEFLS